MDLLGDDALERSAVVANCRMNRGRGLLGSNGYDRELGFNPLDELKRRSTEARAAAWLDLCCGSGKALIEAVRIVHDEGLDVEIVGVDLAGLFLRVDPELNRLRLVEASLGVWRPDRSFDLITCVHGLHYVGDKLGLISRAASWLTGDGLFVASLDLHNVRIADGESTVRRIAADLRRAGLEYDRKRRLAICRGRKVLDPPYRYLGADDQAGPNYTGQPAVDSYYADAVDIDAEQPWTSRPGDPAAWEFEAGATPSSGSTPSGKGTARHVGGRRRSLPRSRSSCRSPSASPPPCPRPG